MPSATHWADTFAALYVGGRAEGGGYAVLVNGWNAANVISVWHFMRRKDLLFGNRTPSLDRERKKSEYTDGHK
jgi:hypothetical protein